MKHNNAPIHTMNDDPPLMRSLSSSSDESEEGNQKKSFDLDHRRWVSLLLARLWKKDESTEENKEQRERRRRRIAVAALTTMVAIWWIRKTRRKTGGTQRRRLLLALLDSWKQLGRSDTTTSLDYRRAKEAPLSLLWTAAKQGSVQRALLLGSQSGIAYQIDGMWRRSALPPQNPSIQQALLETLSSGGCSDVSVMPDSIWSRLATPTLAAIPFVYLALLYRMMRHLHSGDADTARTYDKESSQQTTFADVAGLDNVITEVSEVVSYLSNPTTYRGLGARPPRGILLYGPPGSGKTLLARAVAGEAGCEAFVACSGSDFVETYVGRGAARIRALFDDARAQAEGRDSSWFKQWLFPSQQSPPTDRPPSAVVFMDEIDALAKSRSTLGGLGSNDERDQTLNQLLTEMDGFASHEGVTLIFIAATNRADVLDPAILRRFDRKVHVGYPDANGRKAILQIHARHIHHGRVDFDSLASDRLTEGFSGADLRNVINDAALLAVRDKSSLVEQHHLLQAVRRVKQMKVDVGPSGIDFSNLVRLR